jgi:hypothetical protein
VHEEFLPDGSRQIGLGVGGGICEKQFSLVPDVDYAEQFHEGKVLAVSIT